jgi:hypothetical protein
MLMRMTERATNGAQRRVDVARRFARVLARAGAEQSKRALLSTAVTANPIEDGDASQNA